jgi:hypothetical protein
MGGQRNFMGNIAQLGPYGYSAELIFTPRFDGDDDRWTQ